VLLARERALTPCISVVFISDSYLSLSRSLGACQSSSTNTLFGQVEDIFFVIKFQVRKNEHDHGLLWVKDAPKYGINNNYEIESFVDMYIICNKFLLLKTFCKSQLHCHK
jgi:hypothetical protein